jgi:hypothetical protein
MTELQGRLEDSRCVTILLRSLLSDLYCDEDDVASYLQQRGFCGNAGCYRRLADCVCCDLCGMSSADGCECSTSSEEEEEEEEKKEEEQEEEEEP